MTMSNEKSFDSQQNPVILANQNPFNHGPSTQYQVSNNMVHFYVKQNNDIMPKATPVSASHQQIEPKAQSPLDKGSDEESDI